MYNQLVDWINGIRSKTKKDPKKCTKTIDKKAELQTAGVKTSLKNSKTTNADAKGEKTSQVMTKAKTNTTLTSIQPKGQPVRVNVYKMKKLSKELARLGITGGGIYHSGVEVYETEWAYGGHPGQSSGIFQMIKPRDLKSLSNLDENFQFMQTLRIGYTELSLEQIKSLLKEMGTTWTGYKYHLFRNNCNCFANQLCLNLCGRGIPTWINRSANTMASIPFIDKILPQKLLTPQKVKTPGQLKKGKTVKLDSKLALAKKSKDILKSTSIKCSKSAPSTKDNEVAEKEESSDVENEPTPEELEEFKKCLLDHMEKENQQQSADEDECPEANEDEE